MGNMVKLDPEAAGAAKEKGREAGASFAQAIFQFGFNTSAGASGSNKVTQQACKTVQDVVDAAGRIMQTAKEKTESHHEDAASAIKKVAGTDAESAKGLSW